MTRRTSIIGAIVIAASITAIAAFTLMSSGRTSEVSSKDASAVADEKFGSTDDATAGDSPGKAAEGTSWTMVGEGWDGIDLPNQSNREFPEEVTLVRTGEAEGSDGCGISEDVVFIEEHVERREICTSAAGLQSVPAFATSMTFLGSTETDEYDCGSATEAVRIPAAPKAGASWTYTCTAGKGDDAKQVRYEGSVVGPEAVTVDGKSVPALHVRLDGTYTGKATGTERIDLWLPADAADRDDVPMLRRATTADVTSPSMLGDVRFREKTDYTLASRTPSNG